MTLISTNPTGTQAWTKLREHYEDIAYFPMVEMFAQDPQRAQKFHIKWNDFLLDFSKNKINETTLSLLVELAHEMDLKDAIQKMFSGEIINKTEQRAVLHTALRANRNQSIFVDGVDVIPEVFQVKAKIKSFTDEVINGTRKGFTGQAFTDVVNIGIGGSDLGPQMVVEALKFYKNHLNLHFVSNIDGDGLNEVIKNLSPAPTPVVIVSKPCTAQEAVPHATPIKQWSLES